MCRKGLFALLVISALLLSSCGAQATPEVEEPKVEAPEAEAPEVEAPETTEEKITITWWSQTYGEIQETIENEFVASFNAAHPDVQLELTFQEDRERQVQTAVQAGVGPDIITTVGPSIVFQYMQGDRLLPLDEYAEQYGWKQKMLPWAYDISTIQGHIYSLPLTYDTTIVFYNKTVLEDTLGLEPPTNLQELEAICEAATEIGKWCFVGSGPYDLFWAWPAWEHYIGADQFYLALTDQIQWTDTVFKDAVQLTKDWVDKGWVSGDLEMLMSLTYSDHFPPLANGDAVFLGMGTWGFNSVATAFGETGQEWDWLPWPSLNPEVKSVYDLSVGETVSINAATEHPDEAAMVIDWLYNSNERAARVVEGMNFSQWVVPLKYTSEDFSPDTDERLLRYMEDFAEVTAQGRIGYTHWTFLPDTMGTTWIENELDNVWYGTMTIDEYLQGLQALFDQEYAAGNVIPPPEPDVR